MSEKGQKEAARKLGSSFAAASESALNPEVLVNGFRVQGSGFRVQGLGFRIPPGPGAGREMQTMHRGCSRSSAGGT